jgi:hypothetical protein
MFEKFKEYIGTIIFISYGTTEIIKIRSQTSLLGILIMHILDYIKVERNINNFYLDFIGIKQQQIIEKYKLNIKYINIIGSFNHSKFEANFLKYIIYYKQN